MAIRVIRGAQKVPQRRNDLEDLGLGILTYGIDNVYPQVILQRLYASGNLTNAIAKVHKFVKGEGFAAPELKALRANRLETFNTLLRKIAYSLVVHRGFALHFNYNALGQISQIQHVPFEFCRLGDGQHAGQVAVFEDWGGEYKKRLSIDQIDYIDLFDPKEAELTINELEYDLSEWKGQIFYFSLDEGYPSCSFDSILEDVESDARIKNFNLKTIKNGFAAGFILEYPGTIETAEEEQAIKDSLKPNMGDENAGSVMVIENPQAAEVPLRLLPVSMQDQDKMYIETGERVRESIYSHYDILPVLRGDAKSGLFNQEQMKDAYTFFNEITKDYRDVISEQFAEFMPHFVIPTSGNYSIIEKQFGNGLPDNTSL